MAFPNRNLLLPQTILPLMPHYHVKKLFHKAPCSSSRAKAAAVPEPRLGLNPNPNGNKMHSEGDVRYFMSLQSPPGA